MTFSITSGLDVLGNAICLVSFHHFLIFKYTNNKLFNKENNPHIS